MNITGAVIVKAKQIKLHIKIIPRMLLFYEGHFKSLYIFLGYGMLKKIVRTSLGAVSDFLRSNSQPSFCKE